MDASVALSWLLPGENAPKSLLLRDSAVEDASIRLFVPPHFWYEVANVLWVATRRKRMATDMAVKALESLIEFKFITWNVGPQASLSISIQQNLAVYDSAYLNLALERNATLWTLDRGLVKAAARLDIAVEPDPSLC